MNDQNLTPISHFLRIGTLLPVVAAIMFIALSAIAEYQIRSSPKWPPPKRHEVGGWQIDDPPLWDLAAGLNLPATVPVVWMAALSDRFTYALDDHQLIIYVPWIFFVFLLWYFVAYQMQYSMKRAGRNPSWKYLVFAGQMLITGELISCAIVIFNQSPADHRLETPSAIVVCFWAWVLATVVGWINLIRRWKNQASL
jgi:hypothetical protein